MQTTRIVLMEPFVRHPAGQVFELEAITTVSDWDPDERVRERLSFTDKRAYLLPDAGNGLSAELLLSKTKPCPEAVFGGIDLRIGPCRVTGAMTGSSQTSARPSPLKYDTRLLDFEGHNAQAILIPLLQTPQKVVLEDRLRNEILQHIPIDGREQIVDFGNLMPGFYQVTVAMPDGQFHFISVFKAFPLLVTALDDAGRYVTQKTLY